MARYGQNTRTALKENKLAPKKKFGQNFLVNRHTAEAIVDAGNISTDDTIVEVGVGLGALTGPIAARAKQVIGFEIDSGIVRFHQTEGDLPSNVVLHHQDILKADFSSLVEQYGGPLKIMANLPYSISNPFIFKLIDNSSLIHSATIMLQKEVACRLTAEIGTKEYGVPTILLASRAKVIKQMILKPAEFHPRPKIDSMVITIRFCDGPNLPLQPPPYDFTLFMQIVRMAFNQRRKTLLNTLSSLSPQPHFKKNLETVIADSDISPSARPETLSPLQFIQLSTAIHKMLLLLASDT